MQFTIEKNVPVTRRSGGGGHGAAIYPFANMEVGDSFAAPDDMGVRSGGSARQNSISACMQTYVKRHNPNAKFTTRTLRDEGVVRCWRVA